MKKICVLLAEDDTDQRDLFTYILEMEGFEVRPVTNGKEALAELQRSPPDVVLTDIAMPDMNGLELVQQVKSRAELAKIPIVVMTAFDEHYLRWAEVMGAIETISKPFEPQDLFMTILNALPESVGN